jgi:hypothetical protein
MDVWYDASTVFLTDFKPFPNSTYNYIVANMTNRDLLGPKTFASVLNSTKLTPEEQKRILAGAPFVDGKSTAKIFYTVTDYSDSLWMYNYNLYYSWNGCSNQAVSLSFNGTDDVQAYIMCPSGVHEADLERMSMLVCKNDQKIKQIAYSQHAWSEVRDCQIEGQCLFDEDTGNPISYVALEGHGNYPENQAFHVYYYMGSSIGNFPLQNVGGIYVGDRTGDDPEKTFIPTPENIVYIPPLWEIQGGSPGINPEEWSWAEYPGNWGAPLMQSPLTLECLNPSSTEYIPCDENSTVIKGIYSIAKFLNLGDVIDGQEGVSSSFSIQNATNSSVVGYPDITGPMFRSFSYQYISGNTAPILSENVTILTCPKDTTALEEIPVITQLNASSSTIVSYLVGVTVGTLIFSIILIFLLALPLVLDKTTNVQQYVATKYQKLKGISKGNGEGSFEKDPVDMGQSKTETSISKEQTTKSLSMSSTSSASGYLMKIEHVLTKSQLLRLFVWGTFATCLFIAGIILISIGLQAMFDRSILTVAADRLNADSIANALYWLTTGCLIFVVACDVIMFFLIFMFQPKRIHMGKISIRNPLGGWNWFMNKALTILSVIVGLISMIIALCAVLFSLGLLISIIQLAARVACNALFNISVEGTSVQSICLDIPSLNIKLCGWEALQACSNVTTMTVRNIMIGSMLLLWCHILWMVIILILLESYRSLEVCMIKQRRKGDDDGTMEESFLQEQETERESETYQDD